MSEVRIDLQKHTARIGNRLYVFKVNEHYDSDYDTEASKIQWYKENREYAISAEVSDSEEDAERIPVDQAEEMDRTGEEWSFALDRVTDLDLIKRLSGAFNKADAKAKAKREELEQVKKWLAQNPGAREAPGRALVVTKLPRSSPTGARGFFDWEVTCSYSRYLHNRNKKLRYGWWKIDEDGPIKIEKDVRLKKVLRKAVLTHKEERTHKHSDEAHRSQKKEKPTTSPQKKTDVPKRTKWGTRIWSNDKEHYFAVGVWKSKKYEGCVTVRLSVAGKNYLYTLDHDQMEALRREISRGEPT